MSGAWKSESSGVMMWNRSSLKKKVAPKNWDNAKGKREEIVKLNEHIERARTLVSDTYHELITG